MRSALPHTLTVPYLPLRCTLNPNTRGYLLFFSNVKELIIIIIIIIIRTYPELSMNMCIHMCFHRRVFVCMRCCMYVRVCLYRS